jgi:hypothetical protein
MGGWVSPRAGLDVLDEKKNLLYLPGFQPLVVQVKCLQPLLCAENAVNPEKPTYTSNIVGDVTRYLCKYKCIVGCDTEFSGRTSPVLQMNLKKAAGSFSKLHRVTFQKSFLLFHSFLQCILISQHREQNCALKSKGNRRENRKAGRMSKYFVSC